MFSYHQKYVHSYVKADDPNRFFFLFKTHLLSKVNQLQNFLYR